MRVQHPVFYDEGMPMPLWQIFRYEDVATVLTDYSRFSSQALGVFMGSFDGVPLDAIREMFEFGRQEI